MKTVGFIYAIAAAVTWGLVYTIDQKILDKVSPLSLIFVDAILVASITLPIILLDTQSLKVLLTSGKLNLSLILAAVILATLANFFIFSGIKILGAPTASIFEIAYPFFVILFSFLIFKTSLDFYFLLGSVFIFIGSLIIIKLA
ncbi:MAG: DMT family transporter [Patescibacteria group bacterium]|jgi:drug/metabolite transporter (DMT)-like permease